MNDMTKGNIARQLIIFSIPVFLGNIFQNLYSIIDSVIVGQYLGVNALAAVGIVGPILFMVTGIMIGVSGGFGLLIARAYGAKKEKLMKHYIAMSSILCAIIVIVVMVILISCNDMIWHAIQVQDDIWDDTVSYTLVIYIGLPATILYNMLAAIARALGDSKTPLYFLVVSSVLNIVLDFWFVGGLSTGVVGAAYATIIAQAISAIICFVYVYRKYPEIRFNRDDARINLKTCATLISLGLPMALQYSVISMAGLLIQWAVNQLGTTYIAATSAYYKMAALFQQTYMSLGVALANFVGQNLGAKEYERVKKGVRYSTIMGVMMCIGIMIVSYYWGGMFIGIFVKNPSQELEDAITQLFHVVLWYFPIHAIINLYRNALQGLGKGMVTMMSAAAELIARIIVITIFFNKYRFAAVCATEPIAWFAALFLLWPTYAYYAKKMLK